MPTVDFSLVKSETIPLTRDIALKHRDMESSPTERELMPSRVKFLRQKVEDSLFVCPSWAVAEFQKRTIRMNGRHSSTALCETNGDFPEKLYVHLDTYKVETPKGLAGLFRQFDARQSGRSSLDVCGAYQGLYEPLSSVDRRYCLSAVKGISWYKRQVEKVPCARGDDVGEMLSDEVYHGFIVWLGNLFNSKCKEIQSDPVVGAMYGTFEANEPEARKFWQDVAKGGVDEGSVAQVLSDVLTKNREQKDSTKKLTVAQQYGVAIRGWNSYREGKTVTGITQQKKKPCPEMAA